MPVSQGFDVVFHKFLLYNKNNKKHKKINR